jgi:hypothetical protein
MGGVSRRLPSETSPAHIWGKGHTVKYYSQWRRFVTDLRSTRPRPHRGEQRRSDAEDVLAVQCAEGEARIAFEEAMEFWACRPESHSSS